MYLGATAPNKCSRLRGLGQGGTMASPWSCPAPGVILNSCPPGYFDTGPYGALQRCCIPAPAPAASGAPVTVSPVITTQVSPQISPIFQQAFQPSGSPMSAGASMAPVEPRVIRSYEGPAQTRKGYESLGPETLAIPTGAAPGPIVTEAAPVSMPASGSGSGDTFLPALLKTPEAAPESETNYMPWILASAAALVLILAMTRKKGKRQ